MTLDGTQFEIAMATKKEPSLKIIFDKLRLFDNAFCATTGSAISGLIGARYREAPVLFIASKRMKDIWIDSRNYREAHITINGCEAGFWSKAYLTWSGVEFSFAIDTLELTDVFSEGGAHGQVLVVWISDTKLSFDSFSVDEDFLDFVDVARQARHIPRFIPDEDYIRSKIEGFPRKMSPDEQCFIGADGEPVYLVVSCEELGEEDSM